MTAETIIDIIGLGLTTIGLILVIVGWIIPYKQKIKFEIKRKQEDVEFQKLCWEKEFIDKQIDKVYGPIYMLIKEHAFQRMHINDMLGSNVVFSCKRPDFASLTEREQKIWVHYVDTYKIPLNNQIANILKQNYHLLENIEPCVNTFLDYAIGWELLDNQKRNGVPNFYEYHYIYSYPEEFDVYIETTLHLLQNKSNDLRKRTNNTLIY